MRRSSLRLITTFGLGHMRPASGTWGSLPSVVIAAALIFAGAGPLLHPALYYSVLSLVLLIFSWACVRDGDAAEARFGRKDPSHVVADETAGQCIPLLLIPAWATTSWQHSAIMLASAFLAFRILDIIKPWPAGALQKVPGGWGILIDDLVAGVYAGVAVLLTAWAVAGPR